MSQHIINITKKDPIQVIAPTNGETTWMHIKYGGSNQLWVDRVAAEKIRDGINEVLAQFDAQQQGKA